MEEDGNCPWWQDWRVNRMGMPEIECGEEQIREENQQILLAPWEECTVFALGGSSTSLVVKAIFLCTLFGLVSFGVV
jgi:hypothetical protein